ncbi:unnamed protein product, partial [Closterium sp. NIES-53]
ARQGRGVLHGILPSKREGNRGGEGGRAGGQAITLTPLLSFPPPLSPSPPTPTPTHPCKVRGKIVVCCTGFSYASEKAAGRLQGWRITHCTLISIPPFSHPSHSQSTTHQVRGKIVVCCTGFSYASEKAAEVARVGGRAIIVVPYANGEGAVKTVALGLPGLFLVFWKGKAIREYIRSTP